MYLRTRPFIIIVSLWIVAIIIIALLTRPGRAAAQAGCNVRSDWPTYTIRRGDTLYLIARRYNSTTLILATANCLTNSNRIYAGQTLHVPGAGGATLPPITNATKPITFQPYEGGYLLWWAESGEIWELTGAQSGSLVSYPSRTYGGLPDNPVRDATPPNRVRPIMGFGRLWGNFALVRNQLGWATASEQSFISSVNYDAVSRRYLFTVPGGHTLFSDGHTWNLFTGTLPTQPPPQPTITPLPGGLVSIPASYQPFENGFMIWDSSSSMITAYFGTNGGTIAGFASTTYGSLPDNRIGNPPLARFSPILGIGKVWGNNEWVRNQLGWATSQELSYGMLVRHSMGETSFDFQIPVGREYAWVFNMNYRTWNYESSSPVPVVQPAAPPVVATATSATTTGFDVTTNAAYQVFENGFMVWRADTGDIWVFPKQSNVNYFGQFDYQNLPDNPVTDTPPTARLSPINGFGRVWGNVSQIRSALGWAMDAEQNYSATLHTIYVPSPDGVKSIRGLCLNLPDGRSAQYPQYVDETTIIWGYVDSCG
jgi:LysM repeat protein